MKKYILISGLELNDNNRGTAALGYGSLGFLYQKGYLQNGQEIVRFEYINRFWQFHDCTFKTKNGEETWTIKTIYIFKPFAKILLKYGIVLGWKLKRYLNNTEYVAAINGGDGLTDIYDVYSMQSRLIETRLALIHNIKVIQLPQTIGPFLDRANEKLIINILKKSYKVYVRDEKFVSSLKNNDISYELEKDLSAYMKPQAWNISIPPNSVGLNISGLCYSNNFKTLKGQFSCYPKLLEMIVEYFQKNGVTVFIIPHSYDYNHPEKDNDDLSVSKIFYESLKTRENVVLLNKELTSPQIKYVISKMTFFVGSRMHANFAAIYTRIPVFGLAYSYKFEGAFNANGLDGSSQTYLINNIKETELSLVVSKIIKFYESSKR